MSFSARSATLALPLVLSAALAVPAFAVPAEAKTEATQALVGRVWVEQKPGNGLPGVMRIFLADGTLVMDSCWETYTLRKWQRTGPDSLAWDEDGARLTATVTMPAKDRLVLKVKAGRDTLEQRYVATTAPYLCPEMKR